MAATPPKRKFYSGAPWEKVLGKKVVLRIYEDNEKAQKIIASGKFKAMSHVSRTHGLALSFSHDCHKRGLFSLRDCHTKSMCADIFTKYFTEPLAWQHARKLLGILPRIKGVTPEGGGVPTAANSSGASSVGVPADVHSLDGGRKGVKPEWGHNRIK